MRWLRVWPGKKRPVPIKRAQCRLQLEALESRELLAVVGLATPAPISPSGAVASALPTFTWNAVTGADHYAVQVDDQTSNQAAVLSNQAVIGTSWTATTPLGVGDTYNWYVGALDSTNTVVSYWSSALTFTISALGAPTLVGPSGSITSAAPALTWNAVAGADHYDVWVNDQTTGQAAVLRDQDVLATSWTPTAALKPGDTYTFWVRALDNSGTDIGAWSGALSFSVASLGQPILLGPTGIISSGTPALTWNAAVGADHYDVWVSDLTTGQSPLLRNEDVLGTSWAPATALAPGHTYRWWVRSVDSTNTNDGTWSAAANFTVASLGQTSLTGPSGPVATGEPLFTWNTVTGADHYDVWVDDQTTGKSAVYRDQYVIGTSWTPATPMTPGDNYRWWVRAVDSSSTNFGTWSAPLNVTVTPLAVPTLVGPGGSIVSVLPTFSWNVVAAADHYDIWVDDETKRQTALLRNQDVSGTTWVPSAPLAAGDTYRWWVRAVDSTGTNHGAWSSYVDFTVAILAAPALIGPKGSAGGAATLFSWNTVIGADHYDVWVNDLTTGKSAVLRNQDVVGTSWTPTTSMTAGQKYRWWVRAIDLSGGNVGAWSNSLDFTVPAL